MNYKVDKKNYRIHVSGDSYEIKDLIYEIALIKPSGKNLLYNSKDELDNIESLTDKTYMEFINFERLYFNKDSITYLPNSHSKEGKKMIFDIFILPSFENAIKNYEEKHKS